MTAGWSIELLSEPHDLSQFSSGVEDLDSWLARAALTAQAKGTARTYLLTDGAGRVRGYFSLCPHLLLRADAPRTLVSGDPDQIPSLLLARLALDSALHGQGLGGLLLAAAEQRAVAACERAGGRLLVVDAIDERAAKFYEHFGYRRLPAVLRLMRKISDIARDHQT